MNIPSSTGQKRPPDSPPERPAVRVRRRPTADELHDLESALDEALKESFPASDSPAVLLA